jgi:PAS domain S-box-containing protein
MTHSLQWRSVLWLSSTIAAVLATFLSVAYREVEASLLRAGGERAQAAADQTANLIAQSAQQALETLRRMSTDPHVRRYLRDSTDEAREAARDRLTAMAAAGPRRIELWDESGSRALEILIPPPPPRSAAVPLPAGERPVGVGLSPFREQAGVVFSDAVAEIRDEPAPAGAASTSPRLGFLRVRSTISVNPPGIISRLVGNDAVVEIGNSAGGVWMDFSRLVPMPPVDATRRGIAEYRDQNGRAHLGAVATIRATPWAVWVEFPRAAIVAPARAFLVRMTALAVIFLFIGATLVWIQTRRVTTPLRELAKAAEEVAAGDYSRRVSVTGPDELGRLGEAFNMMAGQTGEAYRRLEIRVREKTAILEGALDSIITMDQEGVIREFNPAAEALFGYSRTEAIGRQLADLLIPTSLQQRHREGLARYAATGEGPVIGKRLELPAVRKDGSELKVELSVIAIQADGVPIFTGFIRDLTDQKLAEAARLRSVKLEEENRRVQDANRLKSEFLANMSHELRTPLNAIIGFAELMHDGKLGPVSPLHEECLDDILTSSRHLLQLINDVLDLSKVEAGKMDFRPESVDVSKVVGEVRDILRGLAARKRIEIAAEVDPGLGTVVVDPGKLKQVLYNYLSNALKFTPDGGRVAIRASGEDADQFRLEVEDSGIGIRAEDVSRLFVEFQQLDASVAKAYPGTGLGLALTKRIVEAQGGQVGVRSTPGKGSLFFAVLPRVTPGAQPVQAATVPRLVRPGAPSILVIEDDNRDRAWLVETLVSAGYAVEVAATGQAALELCRQRAFDGITLDLLLPDMSGWQVLRELRSGGPNQRTPAFVVTVVAEKGIGAGYAIHDYLVKPLRAEALLSSLQRGGILPAGSRSILVVDDDPQARKLMETTLQGLGYHSRAAASAEEGLRVAGDVAPAAVVLDLLMPEMDGFEFLERFRRMPAGRATPVIVWTAKDLTAEDYGRLAASAQAVVLKSEGGVGPLIAELRTCIAPPVEDPTPGSASSVDGG